MRYIPQSLKHKISVFNNLEDEFWPDMFYDISGEVADRAASILFGKNPEITVEKHFKPEDIEEFLEKTNLLSKLYRLELNLSIDGGELVYLDSDENNLPTIRFSKFYKFNQQKTELTVYEKIPYNDPISGQGYVTIKKKITNKTTNISFWLYDSYFVGFPQESIGQGIDLDEFNRIQNYYSFSKTSWKTPFGQLKYWLVMNKDAETFQQASDTSLSDPINIAMQRSLYFAIADTEKTQSQVYVLGDNDNTFDIDPILKSIKTRPKVITDRISLINSDDENGKVNVVSANPQAHTYLSDFESYEKLYWQRSGYSFGDSNAISTAIGVKYFQKGDITTSDMKKKLRESQLRDIIATLLLLYNQMRLSLADELKLKITIVPNYNIDLDKLIDISYKEFRAGVINLPELIAKVKNISLDEAEKYLENQNKKDKFDYINGRMEDATKLAGMGIFDKSVISKFLFGKEMPYLEEEIVDEQDDDPRLTTEQQKQKKKDNPEDPNKNKIKKKRAGRGEES